MSLPNFSPTGSAGLSAGSTSTAIALPGSGNDSTILVSNLGPGAAVVALGNNSVSVNGLGHGIAVVPGHPLALTRGTATTIAALCVGGPILARLNIESGN